MVYGYVRVSTTKQSIDRQIRNIRDMFPGAVIIADKYTGTKMERPEWSKLYAKLQAGDLVVFDEVSRMSRDADEGFRVYEELLLRGTDLIFLKERHIDTATYKKAMQGQVNLHVDSGNEAADEFIDGVGGCINKYLLALAREQIKIAFEQAQSEVEHLHKRTSEGVQEALRRYREEEITGRPHKKGKPGSISGKPRSIKKAAAIKELIVKYSKDFDGTLTDSEVISVINGLEKLTYSDNGEVKEIAPLAGSTKNGKPRSRYIVRATYYKYKREIRAELDGGQIVGQLNIFSK